MTTPFDQRQFIAALEVIRGFDQPDASALQALRASPRSLAKILREIHGTQTYLDLLQQYLDATLTPPFIFTMNDPETVGEVIVFKLEQEPKTPLVSVPSFYGSGVYAIYYENSFQAYQAISGTNCPIYVGKAGPKVTNAETPKQQGTSLFARVTEHRLKSIEKASNLCVADFTCRYLVVQSGLEKAAEDFLIRRYSPVWNEESKVCSGLGKHGDIARQEKSVWDVLHPGRPWAAGQSSRSGATPASIAANIDNHFLELFRLDPVKWAKIFNPSWLIAKRLASES
jgi:hypothetical protein